MKKSVLEQLSEKYFEHTGTSPNEPFYGWLLAMGVGETDEDLQSLLDDEELWESFEEE